MDHGAYPPYGIGRQAEAAIGIETIDGADHADVALGNQIGEGQAIAAEAGRDLYDESEMTGDQAIGGVRILMLAPTLGERALFARLDQRKLVHFPKIASEIGVPRCYAARGCAHEPVL